MDKWSPTNLVPLDKWSLEYSVCPGGQAVGIRKYGDRIGWGSRGPEVRGSNGFGTKCVAAEEDCANFCGLLRKAKLYEFYFFYYFDLCSLTAIRPDLTCISKIASKLKKGKLIVYLQTFYNMFCVD